MSHTPGPWEVAENLFGSRLPMSRIDSVVRVLELLLARHKEPLLVLLGEVDPPSFCHWAEILSVRGEDIGRVDGSPGTPEQERLVSSVDDIERVIVAAGGWAGIVAATQEVRQREPMGWNLFVEHVLWVGEGSKLDLAGGQLDKICDRYGVCRATVWRWRAQIPRLIARQACHGGQRVFAFWASVQHIT
jgi:hypothetical protein